MTESSGSCAAGYYCSGGVDTARPDNSHPNRYVSVSHNSVGSEGSKGVYRNRFSCKIQAFGYA